MDEPHSFGVWLRRRRKALDLTREALAAQVGCAVVTIRKIEADERRPSRQIAERLAECLALPTADREPFLQAARAELAVARLTPPPTPTPSLLPTRPARNQPTAHQQLKGYTLHELIGAGGFGTVYRATQPGVGREVAIKIIKPEFANHPDFVRRFEAEAQLVARLEHPHIVPLYDYWREPDGAYIVMRYVRGGSVQAALTSPWPLERCTKLLSAVGAALAFAHRHGVIHRDIKPGNLLLDADDNVYLADFGIAKDLRNTGQDGQTLPEALIGSPDYLSPEQIRDDPVSPATDVYGLGLLLYVLLAGAHPLSGLTPAERLSHQLTQPLPALRARRPDLPAAIEAVIQRATAKRPAERYQQVAQLIAGWHTALGSGVSDPSEVRTPALPMAEPRLADDAPTEVVAAGVENPYKGLRAFGESDVADFFGRETLIQRLLERLAEADAPLEISREIGAPPDGADVPASVGARFVAVVGPSGSGKSSVVRAGLIPALRQGALPGSEHWFISDLLPGAHPLEELEAALLRVAVNPPDQLLGQLREDERGLLRAIKRVLPADPTVELVLVIDQFEEIFTLVEDAPARELLIASLVAAVAEPRSRLRLIVTLRADFYDRPLLYPGLADLMRARTELVLPLTAPELRRAIVGPAARAGVTAAADLVAEMITAVSEQPGALPLLQYALTELYERRQGPVLTLSDYRASGGVAGALARRADELYARLSPRAQAEARQIFLRLVVPGEGAEDSRRRVRLSELAVGARGVELSNPVIAHYGAYRLLTFDRDPLTREPTVEVAHEALIRSWGRLRGWLTTSRDELRVQRRLTAASSEWGAAGYDPSFLATGARLTQFAALAASASVALNQAELAFLEASQAAAAVEVAAQEARRQRELAAAQSLAAAETARAEQQQQAATRLRRRAVALAGALAVALLLAGAALYFGLAADRNAGLAQEASRLASSRELAAAAVNNLNVDPERSILLALQALAVARTTQAGDALQRAVVASRVQRVIQAAPDFLSPLSYNLFSPDGARLSLSQLNLNGPSTTSILDLASGEVRYSIPGFAGATHWPAGRQLVTEHPPGDQVALTTWETGDTAARATAVITLPVAFADMFWYNLSTDYALVALTRQKGGLSVYRMADGEEIFAADGADTPFSNVAFSADDTQLAAGTRTGGILIWAISAAADGTLTFSPAHASDVRPLSGHSDLVNTIAFSPDGSRLASVGVDNTVRIWDLTLPDPSALRQLPAAGIDPRLVHTLRGHTNEATTIAWSPDGNRVASSSRDRQVIIWDALVGERLFSLVGHTGSLSLIQFSPDGTRLSSGSEDGSVRIWDVTPAHELRAFAVSAQTNTNYWLPLDLSRDGRRIIAATPNVATMPKIFDAATGGQLVTLPTANEPIAGVALSADGSRAATASSGVIDLPPQVTPNVAVWDATSGALIRRFTASVGFLAVALSPDGTRVAATAKDETVHLWDVASGRELLLAHSGPAIDNWPLTFSPDGTRLAASALTGPNHTGLIDVWDAADGRHLLRLEGHEAKIFSLAYDPSGARLASASRDGTAKIWDATSGALLQTLAGHTSTIMGVAWSPTGDRVATAAYDSTARVWDAESGQELRTFFSPSGASNVAFSPDGSQLYASSVDGIARVYLLDLDDLIGLARTRVTRALTPDECRTYLHSASCPNPAADNSP